MKRLLPLLLAITLVLCACTTTIAEEEKVLNILTWGEYINNETILTPFTEETGIKINYSFFDSNEEMLEKLHAVDGGTYDIILASDYAIDIARKEGLLLPLDKSKLANYENINPLFQGQFFDPNDEYTMPYIAGTPLIVYDPAVIDFPITGYNSLWDERLKDSLVLIDDARNIIAITLKSMGESFNVTDPAVLEQAAEKLMTLKPNVRVLEYNEPHVPLISGDATVGYLFTPAVVWALDERPDLAVVIPEEGIGFGIDAVVIPVRAPHPDNAHLFIDFMLRPEIGAAIAEVQAYLCVNQAAEPLLSEAYKSNPAYIPVEMIGDAEYIEDVGADAQSLYMDIWTRFKQY